MRRFRELSLRFSGLFNKQRKDCELDDEIKSHSVSPRFNPEALRYE
jgi:hypothetical protein